MRAWEIFSESNEVQQARQRAQVDAARQRRSNAARKYKDDMCHAADATEKLSDNRASAAKKYQDAMRAAHDAETRSIANQ